MGAKFVRLFGRANLKSVRSAGCEVQLLKAEKIFRQCGRTALQKTVRYSPLSVILARQEPRPPIFASSLVPRPTTRFKSVSKKTKPAIWVARCGLRVEG